LRPEHSTTNFFKGIAIIHISIVTTGAFPCHYDEKMFLKIPCLPDTSLVCLCLDHCKTDDITRPRVQFKESQDPCRRSQAAYSYV